MLVLAVNVGTYVELTTGAGEVIKIFLNKTTKHQARIGFQADKSVKIMRSTVIERDVANAAKAKQLEGKAEEQEEPNSP